MGAYRIQPAGSISEKEGGALKTGQVIGGKYQLVKKLGQGGEGSVYLARHLATGAYWAVKILPRREGEWQIHELQVSKGLRHPGILQITDILETVRSPGLPSHRGQTRSAFGSEAFQHPLKGGRIPGTH